MHATALLCTAYMSEMTVGTCVGQMRWINAQWVSINYGQISQFCSASSTQHPAAAARVHPARAGIWPRRDVIVIYYDVTVLRHDVIEWPLPECEVIEVAHIASSVSCAKSQQLCA